MSLILTESEIDHGKQISQIWLDNQKNIYYKYYDIWYNHYKTHIKNLYQIINIPIDYDIFCKYLFEGTLKKTNIFNGIKIPSLI